MFLAGKIRTYITSLVSIAIRTGIRKVFRVCISAVFNAYDMVDLESIEREFFREMAVFTTKSGAFRYLLP